MSTVVAKVPCKSDQNITGLKSEHLDVHLRKKHFCVIKRVHCNRKANISHKYSSIRSRWPQSDKHVAKDRFSIIHIPIPHSRNKASVLTLIHLSKGVSRRTRRLNVQDNEAIFRNYKDIFLCTGLSRGQQRLGHRGHVGFVILVRNDQP